MYAVTSFENYLIVTIRFNYTKIYINYPVIDTCKLRKEIFFFSFIIHRRNAAIF